LKPDQAQSFYPAPPTLLNPNPRLRPASHQIDRRTANILENKEKELMQTTQQTDYYKDGLGTRAPLKSDNLEDKISKYEQTGQIDEEMVHFFCFFLIF
jgi:hypothetical protein